MKFLLDESVDIRHAHHLRALGHDVTSIVHDHPRALKDSAVLMIARREDRILITNDSDFGELVVRKGQQHAGVILLRFQGTGLAVEQARLETVLDVHKKDLRHLVVVTPAGVRVRR